MVLQLEAPLDACRPGFLKAVHHAAQHRIEIAGSVSVRILLRTAERGQVVGDLGRLLCGFLHFQQRSAPWMVRFHLRQHQGRVAQDTGEHVVEIEGDAAGQLQGAIEFLFVEHRRVARRTFALRHPQRRQIVRRPRGSGLLLDELE